MQRTTRSAQRAEIVPMPSGERGRDVLSGPATRWMMPEENNIAFPIERLAGGDVGQVGSGLAPLDPVILGGLGGSEEYSTPVSRAKGQVIRLLPFSVVWLLLTGGVVWLLGLTLPYLLIGFALLTAATFVKMNGQEFDHSRNGLERHRVDTAADLREKEMDQQHELRSKALDAYLEIARAQYLGVTTDDNNT